MMSSRMTVLALLATGACGNGGGFPADAAADSPDPGGTFSLAWTVTDTGGAPITCSQIGAQVVTVTLRNPAIQGGQTEVFSCASAMATSSKFPPGMYDLTYELNGLAGLLGTAPGQLGIVINSEQDTPVNPVSFAVDATGGLELNLASGASGGNCEPTGMMGAGITGTSITLLHSGAGCEPVTFAIAAGATKPAGSYTVNCASPTVAPCIESDQKMTVSGVPSGNYAIHIRGKIGATDCWINNDSLKVPPLSKVLKATLNLAHQTTPGC
jgi:hypothetical protein